MNNSYLDNIDEIIASIDTVPDNFINSVSDSTIEDMFLSPIKMMYNVISLHNDFDYRRKYSKIMLSDIELEYDELCDCISKKRSDYANGTNANKVKIVDSILNYIIDVTREAIDTYHWVDAVIFIEKCRDNARIPSFAHDFDAGADVYAAEDVEVAPHSTVIVPTGLKMAIPHSWKVSVRPRSGMSAKTNIRIANAPGTIDAGYLDEVGIIVTNIGDEPYHICAGDRIAQFVVERRYDVVFVECDDVKARSDTSSRENSNGSSGFGSTGK